MKTLYRVLIILTVALIIGGLIYAGVSASDSSANSGGFEEGGPRPPEGMEEFRPDGDRDEGGFGFPAGMVKALVLMTIAGGIYSGIAWMWKKAKPSPGR